MGVGIAVIPFSKDSCVVCVWMYKEKASGSNQIPFGRLILDE
jgi:hypothetical protein